LIRFNKIIPNFEIGTHTFAFPEPMAVVDFVLGYFSGGLIFHIKNNLRD